MGYEKNGNNEDKIEDNVPVVETEAGKCFFERFQIVIPGSLLGKGRFKTGDGCYRENDAFYASVVGLADFREGFIMVVPLEGTYIPKEEDIVIGTVMDTRITSWRVDIRAPYDAILTASNFLEKPFSPVYDDVRDILNVGDVIVSKILSFDRTRDPILIAKGQGLGRLQSGRIIEILPTKVPRVIGKRGSMINLLKRETGCRIVVGQNGRIWISGRSFEDEYLVVQALKKIEREAHTSGLTDRVKDLIRNEKEKKRKESE